MTHLLISFLWSICAPIFFLHLLRSSAGLPLFSSKFIGPNCQGLMGLSRTQVPRSLVPQSYIWLKGLQSPPCALRLPQHHVSIGK
jgi:hypothetical protein